MTRRGAEETERARDEVRTVGASAAGRSEATDGRVIRCGVGVGGTNVGGVMMMF